MARPIPVFAFAFAAFAATSIKAADDVRAETARFDRDELFLKMWRASTRADAKVRVRVGVLGVAGAPFRLCDRGSTQEGEADWLWLAQISETTRGFSGLVASEAERPKHSATGQRIRFEMRNILGWTLGINAEARATIATMPAKPSPRFLADLDFS
jgi:uncharacterized protein YegJ (DUF2314 family)